MTTFIQTPYTLCSLWSFPGHSYTLSSFPGYYYITRFPGPSYITGFLARIHHVFPQLLLHHSFPQLLIHYLVLAGFMYTTVIRHPQAAALLVLSSQV